MVKPTRQWLGVWTYLLLTPVILLLGIGGFLEWLFSLGHSNKCWSVLNRLADWHMDLLSGDRVG